MAVRCGAATDRGRMREGNEDNYVSREHLFAVADGMGGHQGGEVASKIAVDTIASLDEGGPWADDRKALDALRAAIKAANRRIRETAARDHTLQGMGTTLTAVLENGLTFYLAHIGDSRAYLYRNGQLTRLTYDHTLVQQLVSEGRLTPEEAEHHPQRSIITRALGVDNDVEPDIATYRREAGDRLLLCTDGLSGVVSEQELRKVLAREPDPQAAADELIAMANAAGGPDNITVVVLDTEDGAVAASGDTTELRGAGAGIATTGEAEVVTPRPQTGRAESRQTRRRGRRWRRLVAALAGVGLLVAGVFGAQAFLASRYWVGYDGDEVAIFQGLPGDVAGVQLSRVLEHTGIQRASVLPLYSRALEDGVTRDSLEDARRYARCTPSSLSLEQCLTGGPTPPTTTTAPKPTTTSAPAKPTTTVRR